MTPSLAQLKDIHPGAAVSWWPLAIGWWLALALLILILVAAGWLYWQKRRKLAIRNQALQAIEALDLSHPQYIHQLFSCMKQACLCYWSRDELAPLHDRAWLAFLDRYNPKLAMVKQFDHLIQGWLYSPAPVPENQCKQLKLACCQWLTLTLPFKKRRSAGV
ncbi:DUF4381 domain-containing protein [Dongshaea marina]|uniref:DUF4381 domain-containing protein n=1 Tax=Dongshaea marina TaxID=2047966 RepID=UPI00131F0A9A|nr:DUF4381 domain-containing protein [Dongshaea marina]